MQNIVMETVEHDLFGCDLQAPRFRINILDEPDEHISVQEIEVSVPTRYDDGPKRTQILFAS